MKIGPPLLALLVLTGCPFHPASKPEPPKAAKSVPLEPSSSDDREERGSLAALANGATVVDRTGEAFLAVTPVNIIDGNPDSYWTAPPHDMPQSATIALPARSRIASVGLRSGAKGDFRLTTARVEAAVGDGPFKTIADVTLRNNDVQFFNVKPVEADRLRLTMISGPVPGHEVRLDSFIVRGTELASPKPPLIGGSWRVNGHRTSFAQFGNHVAGTMDINATGANPMHIEGGAEANRMLRLSWIRGEDYGVAAVSVSPDGKHLSGIDWHEEPIPLFYDEGWLGERTGDARPEDDAQQFAASYIRRSGRWPMYGIAFKPDGSIDLAASEHALALAVKMINGAPTPVRVVSHEFREATPDANRARAQRALDALRAELSKRGVNIANVPFLAAGSDSPRQIPVTDIMRQLYSSVDLEIRR